MSARIVLLFFLSTIFMGAVPTPEFPSLSMSVNVNEATIVFGPPRAPQTVTGAAYSADQVLEQTKTLQDGTHRTRSSVIGHLFRDSQGRARMEQAWKAAPFWITEIFDPVGGFAYILDEQKKIAHRMVIQPPPPQSVATRQSDGLLQTTTEKLGLQTIEGVIAEGTRTTTIIPAGAERNAQPTTLTFETWDSQELKVTVLTRSSNGYTTRLTNLSPVEPDPKRFQPPAHYAVVDEKESFTMTVKFQ